MKKKTFKRLVRIKNIIVTAAVVVLTCAFWLAVVFIVPLIFIKT